MDSAGQFSVFLLCTALGFLGGVAYEPFAVLKRLVGKKVGIATDILFFLFFSVTFIFAANFLRFPSVRVYFYLGILLGWIIYLKSFHNLVAFFKKVCYNRVVKRRKSTKETKTKR